MTVIVAVPAPDGVVMASDSQLTRGNSIVGSAPKIVTKTAGGSEVLIGVAGNYRLFTLACHGLEFPDHPDQNDDLSCDGWAYAVACAFAELAVDSKPPVLDEDRQVDGEALLALGPRLWLINGQGTIRMEKPCAIGSGAPEARGALHAIGRLAEHADPSFAAATAVAAAIDLDPNCGGEIVLVKTRAITGQDR